MVAAPTAIPSNPDSPRAVPVSRVSPVFRSPGQVLSTPPTPPSSQEPVRSATNGIDVLSLSRDALDARGSEVAPQLEDEVESFASFNASAPELETAPVSAPTPPTVQGIQQSAPVIRSIPLPPPVNTSAATELQRGGNFSILA